MRKEKRDQEKTGEQRTVGTAGRKKSWMWMVGIVFLLVLLLLCLRSCRARDEPKGNDSMAEWTERRHEDNKESPVSVKEILPTKENQRVNLVVSDKYRISEENPEFYILYPEENIFDAMITIYEQDGTEIYRTFFIAPGTNVGVDISDMLPKGRHTLDCVVSVYDLETGTLVSNGTTIELNVIYE